MSAKHTHSVAIVCDGCGAESSVAVIPRPGDECDAVHVAREALRARGWGRADGGRDVCNRCLAVAIYEELSRQRAAEVHAALIGG